MQRARAFTSSSPRSSVVSFCSGSSSERRTGSDRYSFEQIRISATLLLVRRASSRGVSAGGRGGRGRGGACAPGGERVFLLREVEERVQRALQDVAARVLRLARDIAHHGRQRQQNANACTQRQSVSETKLASSHRLRTRTNDASEHQRRRTPFLEEKRRQRHADAHACACNTRSGETVCRQLPGQASAHAPCGPSGWPCFARFAFAVSSVKACTPHAEAECECAYQAASLRAVLLTLYAGEMNSAK